MSPSRPRHFSAERLKVAQAQADLTNEALAERVGIRVRLLNRWRAGEVTPSGGNLIALATALGCTAESFYVDAAEPNTGAAA